MPSAVCLLPVKRKSLSEGQEWPSGSKQSMQKCIVPGRRRWRFGGRQCHGRRGRCPACPTPAALSCPAAALQSPHAPPAPASRTQTLAFCGPPRPDQDTPQLSRLKGWRQNRHCSLEALFPKQCWGPFTSSFQEGPLLQNGPAHFFFRKNKRNETG